MRITTNRKNISAFAEIKDWNEEGIHFQCMLNILFRFDKRRWKHTFYIPIAAFEIVLIPHISSPEVIETVIVTRFCSTVWKRHVVVTFGGARSFIVIHLKCPRPLISNLTFWQKNEEVIYWNWRIYCCFLSKTSYEELSKRRFHSTVEVEDHLNNQAKEKKYSFEVLFFYTAWVFDK